MLKKRCQQKNVLLFVFVSKFGVPALLSYAPWGSAYWCVSSSFPVNGKKRSDDCFVVNFRLLENHPNLGRHCWRNLRKDSQALWLFWGDTLLDFFDSNLENSTDIYIFQPLRWWSNVFFAQILLSNAQVKMQNAPLDFEDEASWYLLWWDISMQVFHVFCPSCVWKLAWMNVQNMQTNMWYTLTSDYSKLLAGIVIFFGYIHLYSMQSISWRDHYSQLQLHISAFSSTFRAGRIIYIYIYIRICRSLSMKLCERSVSKFRTKKVHRIQTKISYVHLHWL